MFERWIGPEKFRNGVIDYMKAQSAQRSSRRLVERAGKLLEKISPRDGYVFDQGGVPLVSVEPVEGE